MSPARRKMARGEKHIKFINELEDLRKGLKFGTALVLKGQNVWIDTPNGDQVELGKFFVDMEPCKQFVERLNAALAFVIDGQIALSEAELEKVLAE